MILKSGLKSRIINKLKNYYFYVRENLKWVFLQDAVILDGYPHSKNFGDALNVFIVKNISNKPIIYGKYLFNKNSKSLACIGSILQWCDKSTLVWGAGFIKPVDCCKNQFTNEHIYAVRGYKTLEILKNNMYDISKVKIGDPAVLLPQLHKKIYVKGTKIGILPHYVDKENPWIKSIIDNHDNVTLVDIEQGKDIEGFLKDLHACEFILSSSLHGLILADVYNIKNVWIRFSENIEGGNFKFNDYYSSIGIQDQAPVNIRPGVALDYVTAFATAKPVNIDTESLLRSFPV